MVTTLFENATSAIADVVLPRQSFAERDGTFTSGEHRVQRFYTAQGVIGHSLPDWKIFTQLNAQATGTKAKLSAGTVMTEITQNVALYAEMKYKALAHVELQFPDVGGQDNYYGGTAYQNKGGTGLQWPVGAEDAETRLSVRPAEAKTSDFDGIVVIPTTVLYDRGAMFRHSEVMEQRIPEAHIQVNPADVPEGIVNGDFVALTANGSTFVRQLFSNNDVPEGVVLMPRNLSEESDLTVPSVVESIEKIEQPQPVTEG